MVTNRLGGCPRLLPSELVLGRGNRKKKEMYMRKEFGNEELEKKSEN